MATLLGGSVEHAASGEYGQTAVSVSQSSRMFRGLSPEITTWMSHMDRIHDVPAGFEVTAGTAVCSVAAMEDPTRHLYALQFHPEVAQTTVGTQILERFLFDMAGCSGDWTMESLVNTAVQDMRSRIGEKRALCALSGGVDSSVAAALAYRAIGQQLCCVFVDTGLLRADEGDQVEATFRGHFGAPLVRVDAGDRFFAALAGITDPEQKRKAVGSTFIACFAEQARTTQDAEFLVQGTLYPDVIESGSPSLVPSRVTTMSGDFLRTWALTWLSLFASCSRMRSEISAGSWGSPRDWSPGSHFQVQDSRCELSARLRATRWTSSDARMPWSNGLCVSRAGTTRSGSHLLCCPMFTASVFRETHAPMVTQLQSAWLTAAYGIDSRLGAAAL